METFAPTVHYLTGEVIHVRGEHKPGLSIVKSGTVRVGNYGKDGRYCMTRLLHAGETFGEFTLFATLPRTHNAEAASNSEVIQLDKTLFDVFCKEHPELTAWMLRSLAVKLHDSLEMLDDVRRLPLHVRAAKTLLSLARQSNMTRVIIKQNELSDVLGVTVLSAHQSLKKLTSIGLITIGYGYIDIVSLETIETWTEEQASITAV
ncbi:Crp/Fnr family transcriptional regulator [Alteromonas sediminis]|nr:Crp/Fnr family transcriptional regulator [Alteromonas sediminis]